MSEEQCQHDWVYSPFVALSNPPIYKKICKKCGKTEEERGDYVDSSEYDRTVKKFIGKNGTYKSLE